MSPTLERTKRVIGRSNNAKKRSINARNVALRVIDKVGKGLEVKLSEELRAVGYPESIVRNPKKVTQTLTYIETMTPYINSLQSLRDKTIAALHNKDLDDAKMFDLTMLLKQTDHSLALAQGKSTENVAHKTEVVVFGSDDFLSRQLNSGSVKP